MGRVLLAHLPDDQLEAYLKNACLQRITKRTVTDPERLRELLHNVRVQGYAMTDQELEEGLRSAAVPLRDANGTVVAAMNISTHASRVNMDELRRNLVPPLVSAARLIETDLAAREGRQKA
jgi:IclR family pca regulon transcriptional regulator